MMELLLQQAWFSGIDYAKNEVVETDLLGNEFGDVYIPRIGEYFIHDNVMYKITHVFWNRDKAEVRVKGHVVLMCYVMGPHNRPFFEGEVDECGEWLDKNPDHQGMVYVEIPYSQAMTIREFLSGRWT